MLKGTAGTLFEMIGFDLSAFDLNEKQRLIKEGRRFTFTAEDLRRLLDGPHLHRVSTLHWLQVLVEFVPELSAYRVAVLARFRAASKGPRRPNGATNIISLRCNAEDPQSTAGLLRAVHDYLETQLRVSRDDPDQRILIGGGDGLTFETMLKAKRERQNHDDPYDRLDHLEPELQLWHTKWTELNRIYFLHCGPSGSPDPSTLRTSIEITGRKVPADLKKVDFQSSLKTLMLVGEARMLDCWQYVYPDSKLKYSLDD